MFFAASLRSVSVLGCIGAKFHQVTLTPVKLRLAKDVLLAVVSATHLLLWVDVSLVDVIALATLTFNLTTPAFVSPQFQALVCQTKLPGACVG
jgi:hypothetical protein